MVFPPKALLPKALPPKTHNLTPRCRQAHNLWARDRGRIKSLKHSGRTRCLAEPGTLVLLALWWSRFRAAIGREWSRRYMVPVAIRSGRISPVSPGKIALPMLGRLLSPASAPHNRQIAPSLGGRISGSEGRRFPDNCGNPETAPHGKKLGSLREQRLSVQPPPPVRKALKGRCTGINFTPARKLYGTPHRSGSQAGELPVDRHNCHA